MKKGEGRYVRERKDGGSQAAEGGERKRVKEGDREMSVSAWTQWGYYLCM